MKTIRLNTFETNSSSVHSLTIVSKDDLDKLENYKMFCNYDVTELTDYDTVKTKALADLAEFNITSEMFDNFVKERYDAVLQEFTEHLPEGEYGVEGFLEEATRYYNYNEKECSLGKWFITNGYYVYPGINYYDVESCSYTAKSGETIIALSLYHEG